MDRPSLDELLPKIGSRYSLVVTAAKRARQIVDGAEPAVSVNSQKPVTIALYEILNDKVTCVEPEKSGAKSRS
ncbi:MAG: DNA-directed RNA polymerase subunit omega [Bacillota bacterium]|jgi:DNA-directed RNA polymerase subunit omega|nr:DNA-directed RNA polymerase subunit omega [Bacillota bacterium]HOB91271.1 DNA-directed RNA polymerase subunit omega [Bacillota bacterium]HPZ53676.1 DNA-directed RNA polymerase subunit omega [Bacillota bacterium]HQD17237.1 DNA-directed RNA polymerase subunit omega [Bacillota bacterium]